MVELPSQLNEHWAWEPEVMKHYARDYKTGRPIPDALIAKFKESENFLKGLYLTDFYATALLDLEWHTVLRPVEGCDVAAFERAFLKRYDFPEHTALRFRTTYYNHIFASSYPRSTTPTRGRRCWTPMPSRHSPARAIFSIPKPRAVTAAIS